MTTEAKAAAKPEEKKAPPPLNIFQALPMITGAVTPIGKDRQGTGVPFKFRGIDDVYAALNLLLAKYSVTILPELLESKHEAAGVAKSGATFWRHMIKVRYHFFAGDGSTLKADAEGEGMDTGDKAVPKAYSTAFKAMAFQVFCIPTGEKIDTEEELPEVEAPKAAPAPAKTNGHSKPPPPPSPVPPEEQAAAGLLESLEAIGEFISAEEKAGWQEKHRVKVNELPAYLKKDVVEKFTKMPVKA